MSRIVLTVIGEDRAGLVETLSSVVAAHGGNWEDSQMAELAGKFAGVVVVGIADERVDDLTTALGSLHALMDISAYPGAEADRVTRRQLTVHVLGNDRPGIVHEVSGALAHAGVSIDTMTTQCRDAPMSGGRLFEATVTGAAPEDVDAESVRASLERLAAELQVDVDDAGAPPR